MTTALPAAAQSSTGRWKQIGKTSAGNLVYIDPRSVKTVNGVIHARVRVKFEPPVKTAKGPWVASQTQAMFNCAKSSIAAKENVYYSDEARNKVAERTVNKLPGFGPALEGSMGKIALDYVCKR